LRELGLLSYFKHSGHYQTNRTHKEIAAELLCYALSTAFVEHTGQSATDISLIDATYTNGGPGRVFMLGAESLFELAKEAEAQLTDGGIEIAGLAGNRALRISNRPPLEWLTQYYRKVADMSRNVA